MTGKLIATGIIAPSLALMIFARRWKNTDRNAGYGIAGWGVFLLFCMWA